MDEYVTKSVDVKHVVSPNDSLILESANNIVLDTPVERILIDGMRIRDYVHREIFRRGGASTSVVELESSSSAAVGAKTNFDSVYSREGEFRTEETHCAALDASGSFIDVYKAHVITLEGSNELRLNANSVENIYVGNRTLREVIYNIMNEYRLENRGTYDIAHFEHVHVERSRFGRESGRMGTSHTNTLRTYKITTNYTLIDGEEPDLIIRSSAGVQIDSPNFYLNNQLFQEYIKQFLDERGFFSLQVDTSPGAEIPYTITNFSVQEHGSIFDYKVTLFMYQEDISEDDIKVGIGVYQEESSVHTINLTHFPSGVGKPGHSGDFTALTPGSVYNMYADFLNLRTMTLVPKVHVRDGILTVVLKSFTISIINETSLKIVVEKYEEDLDTYGSNFKFNILLNTDEVTDPASNSYLFKFPPHNNYDSNVRVTQNERSTAASSNLSGVFIYHSNNDQVDNSNEYSNIVYRNRANQNLSSNYVINFTQPQTFRLYTPKLYIYSPVIEESRELIELADYNAHFSNNLISYGGPMSTEVAFSSIDYATSSNTYTIMMNSSALQSNWPRWLDEYVDTGTPIPKFEYIKFLLYGSNSEGSYLIKSNIVVKHRADFTAGYNEDLKIEFPDSKTLINTDHTGSISDTFDHFITNGDSDTDFTLKYVNIYDQAARYSTGLAFTTSNIRNTTSIDGYILNSPRTYTITTNFTDNARTHIIDNIRFRTYNSSDYQPSITEYIVINSNSNYRFDSNKTFTVQLPNISSGTIEVNMGFSWFIYDDLTRQHKYELSSTDVLKRPTGIVTVTPVTGSNRRINISLSSLKDAKGSNATEGSLTNFTATAKSDRASRGTTQRNPSGITSGSNTTVGYIYLSNSAQGNSLNISGTFTDDYGFSTTISNTNTVVSSLSGTIESSATYHSSPRYFEINISSLTNAFGSNPTSGSSFSGFTASTGSTSVNVIQPSLSSSNTVIAGKFQAIDSISSNTYAISGTFTDDYGFSTTISNTNTVVSSLSGTIESSATYHSSPRYFEINISSLTNAFGSNPTSGSSFSGFTASTGSTSVNVIQPSLSSSNTVIAGKFQAIDSISSNTYAIRGTFTDDYGFSTTMSNTITVPQPTFTDHNIEWDGSNYSRKYKLDVSASNSVSTYAWYLSGTGDGNITTVTLNTHSNVTLSCNVTSPKTLNCSNMTQTNNEGFTKTGETESLDLSTYVADSTFSTYAVTYSNERTFTLTETAPASNTIDGKSNTNKIVSRLWGNNSNSNTVTLTEDYLIDNSDNDATLECDVDTQNIVGFIKSRAASNIEVKGTFSNFGSNHTLSFSNLTTPHFSVKIGSDNTPYTSNDNTKFRLSYRVSTTSDGTYAAVSGTNYKAFAFVKMFARSVCTRGFKNAIETELATFDAASNKPGPPPSPTVNTVSTLHVKTTSNVTFSSITSSDIGNHGTPARGGETIEIQYSTSSDGTYGSPTGQTLGSNVTVTGLSANTTYYFKYKKTYDSNLEWTAVDGNYLSAAPTSVTTLKTPTFSNQIYLSYWSRDIYRRISLSNQVYNRNDGTNVTYNSAFSVKLYFSKSEANLFAGTTEMTLTYISRHGHGYYRTIQQITTLNSNYYINLSNALHLDKEIEIWYNPNADNRWQDLYIGLKIEYDKYYPSIQTSALRIKTFPKIPIHPRIHDVNIQSFTANINYHSNIAQMSVTYESGQSGNWYIIAPGYPDIPPDNVYLVVSSDEKTIARNNVRFDEQLPKDLLFIKGSHIYGLCDI